MSWSSACTLLVLSRRMPLRFDTPHWAILETQDQINFVDGTKGLTTLDGNDSSFGQSTQLSIAGETCLSGAIQVHGLPTAAAQA